MEPHIWVKQWQSFSVVLTDDWVIQQRLIGLQLLAKSLTGEEIARELISVLQVDYRISPGALVGANRASTNSVAMTTLRVLYPDILDVGCCTHTNDHVGERFSTPALSEFVTAWINLFSHSPKARLAWQTCTGRATKLYSKTGWWTRYEVIAQLLEMFGKI